MVAVDGIPAGGRARPETAAELAATLREAAAAGKSVIPIGGGRALGMGNPPERFDLALETGALHRLVEYQPADLTVTVEAGVQLERLNEELGQSGQLLPLDPFGGPGHTVGGVLATGWSGPLRLRYGTARDYLIGLRVALPDGSLARSGGRVVKNVSGYDMNKLHLGALGSLGVIVEASFKVFPRPLSELSLQVVVPTFMEAWAQAERALAAAMIPVALELVSERGAFSVTARLAGTESGVRRIAAELGWGPAPTDFWTAHAARGAETWARLSIRPGGLRGLLEALPAGGEWIAQPGTGVAHWFGFDAASLAPMRSAAETAGGSLVILAAPPALKAAVDAWGRPPATAGLMRQIRDAFDPTRTLSPGRFVI